MKLKALTAALLALVSLGILTTCGIETIATLDPPQFTYSGQNQLFLTHNPSSNDSNLKGYEVYYRAFGAQSASDAQSAADVARSLIETAASATTTSTPESCIQLLQTNGFTRIFDADGLVGTNNLRPLFAISSTELSSVVTFNLLLESQGSLPSAAVDLSGAPVANNTTVPYWYYTRSTSPGTNIGITRSVSNSPSYPTPVSFESSYSPIDPDYSGGTTGAGPGSTLYFVFFAVAYGLDSNSSTFNPIFSFPVSLYISFAYQLPSTVQ